MNRCCQPAVRDRQTKAAGLKPEIGHYRIGNLERLLTRRATHLYSAEPQISAHQLEALASRTSMAMVKPSALGLNLKPLRTAQVEFN